MFCASESLKRKVSVRASCRLCDRSRNISLTSKLRPSHVQATHVTCQLLGMRSLFTMCNKMIYFSRDNALSNVSNLEVSCDKRLSEGDGDDDRAIFNNRAHLGPSGGWKVVQLSNIVLPREA